MNWKTVLRTEQDESTDEELETLEQQASAWAGEDDVGGRASGQTLEESAEEWAGGDESPTGLFDGLDGEQPTNFPSGDWRW